MDNIGILDAAIVALLGYAVVFFGLILLMGVVIVMGKAFQAGEKKAAAAAPAAAPAAAGDLEGYKAYCTAYANAGAPTEEEKANAAAAIAACTTAEEV